MDVKEEQPRDSPTLREIAIAAAAAAAAATVLAAAADLDPGTGGRSAIAALGSWWLARRLGLGAAGALLAAVSFGGSAAVLAVPPAGRAAGAGLGPFDLGLLLVVVALVSGWRRAPPSRWLEWLSVPAVAVLLLFVARSFGAPWLAVVPEALGSPGHPHGYHGLGSFALRTAPSVTLPTLALALAGALSASGPLAGRSTVAVLGWGAFLAAVAGVVPVGLAALPAALFLALLAGDGLEAAPRPARIAALLTVVPLALAVTRADVELLGEPPVPGDPTDELVLWTQPPPDSYVGLRGVLQLAGRLHPSVPASSVRATLERLGDDGTFRRSEEVDVDSSRDPDGALGFRIREPDLRRVPNGIWRWSIEILGERGDVLGERTASSFAVWRTPALSPLTLLVLAGLSAALVFGGAGSRGSSWTLIALAALQVVDFALLH